ncbi:Plasmid maintenance system antidote protein [Tsukamurella paurometabola]|uniref:Plasmid maintenance system antidote protein n=1 Tax=Tsukamurella paurometabola TaxID=2061 RepID=A0A3P8LE20_TSUPA|nr:Plasmid maintenance system antidote protein [Tsukamurella paurometabola]
MHGGMDDGVTRMLDTQCQECLTLRVDDDENPVRARRRAQRITQAELAGAVGVSRQTVVSVEKGDYAPSVYLALKLARALDTTVEHLFPLKEDDHVG